MKNFYEKCFNFFKLSITDIIMNIFLPNFYHITFAFLFYPSCLGNPLLLPTLHCHPSYCNE